MNVLRNGRRLKLPDWAIGAGFLRSLVWDHLCGLSDRTPVDDIDVVYFDAADITRVPEQAAESELKAHMPGENWSVRNMARMHVKNGDPPYRDTEDAVAHWLETPTAVCIRLEADDTLTLMAPHGVADLLAGRIRPTPSGLRRIADYRDRIAAKRWPQRWPLITVEGLT